MKFLQQFESTACFCLKNRISAEEKHLIRDAISLVTNFCSTYKFMINSIEDYNDVFGNCSSAENNLSKVTFEGGYGGTSTNLRSLECDFRRGVWGMCPQLVQEMEMTNLQQILDQFQSLRQSLVQLFQQYDIKLEIPVKPN